MTASVDLKGLWKGFEGGLNGLFPTANAGAGPKRSDECNSSSGGHSGTALEVLCQEALWYKMMHLQIRDQRVVKNLR